MKQTRRYWLAAGFTAGTAAASGAFAAPKPRDDPRAGGLRPNDPGDQTEALRQALIRSARDSAVLRLAPGRYRVDALALPAGARLSGDGAAVLVRSGSGPALTAGACDAIVLDGIAVEGEAGTGAEPLLRFSDVARLRMVNVTVSGGAGTGLHVERCGGTIETCQIRDLRTGLLSLDSLGLRIAGNDVARCTDNGIQVWRSAKGPDGSQIIGNRIAEIGARSGGSGQNGNAINIYRAGGVLVSHNTIRRCAFTAIRNNAGDDCQILGNSCLDLGETAIYAEFGFQGCVISGNLVDRAGNGILITNFNEGGRLAACHGNVVRNLRRSPNVETGVPDYGIGIAVEADAALVGNVVENADYAGLSLGYGPYLRDVVCANNIVRGARYGIAVSVAPQAGLAHITGNTLSRCAAGAIVGMEWDKPASGDLIDAAGGRFRNVVLAGNLRGDPAP